MSFVGLALASFGLLLGTRAETETLLPRRGALVGVGMVVRWLMSIASDHAQLGVILGYRHPSDGAIRLPHPGEQSMN